MFIIRLTNLMVTRCRVYSGYSLRVGPLLRTRWSPESNTRGGILLDLDDRDFCHLHKGSFPFSSIPLPRSERKGGRDTDSERL